MCFVAGVSPSHEAMSSPCLRFQRCCLGTFRLLGTAAEFQKQHYCRTLCGMYWSVHRRSGTFSGHLLKGSFFFVVTLDFDAIGHVRSSLRLWRCLGCGRMPGESLPSSLQMVSSSYRRPMRRGVGYPGCSRCTCYPQPIAGVPLGLLYFVLQYMAFIDFDGEFGNCCALCWHPSCASSLVLGDDKPLGGFAAACFVYRYEANCEICISSSVQSFALCGVHHFSDGSIGTALISEIWWLRLRTALHLSSNVCLLYLQWHALVS